MMKALMLMNKEAELLIRLIEAYDNTSKLDEFKDRITTSLKRSEEDKDEDDKTVPFMLLLPVSYMDMQALIGVIQKASYNIADKETFNTLLEALEIAYKRFSYDFSAPLEDNRPDMLKDIEYRWQQGM